MGVYQYLLRTGTIVPDTSDILNAVITEYQDTFGADLIMTPDTPQGLLGAAEALTRTEVVGNNAAVANQINPNIAGGVFLDSLLALTGVQRSAATQTVVPAVTVTGVPGTVIPSNSLAKTAAGDTFISVSDVTLPAGGSSTVNFVSTVAGPVACAANALTQIISGVLGWETVNNTTAGIVGQSTQSDQQARAYRQNTLAFQSVSLAEAITSALYATAGVTSLRFLENVADTTQTIQGIVMVSHSVYACVAGGTDTDVAAAMLENKSSGSSWNGTTPVTIVEPASGQSYTVLFDRPTDTPVLIRVTTSNGNEAEIIQAVLDYAAGNINGLDGFIVSADVSPFEISGAIVTEQPGTFVSKVEVRLAASGAFSTDTLVIATNGQASIIASNITVVIA